MSNPFFTVGHSDRTLDAFLALLRDEDVDMVVDVRRLPGSRRHPQFNEDALAASLADAGLRYRREPALTGRRPVSTDVPPDVNGLWRNRSFHNYSDYALSGAFADGLSRLRADGAASRVAVMCAEAVWWRCHRRIIADHLIAHGDDVVHIIGAANIAPAVLTPGAVVRADCRVVYPAPADRDD